jgi:hypothetical protein
VQRDDAGEAEDGLAEPAQAEQEEQCADDGEQQVLRDDGGERDAEQGDDDGQREGGENGAEQWCPPTALAMNAGVAAMANVTRSMG